MNRRGDAAEQRLAASLLHGVAVLVHHPAPRRDGPEGARREQQPIDDVRHQEPVDARGEDEDPGC